jgi:very-short-patch-repair endonuclease
MQVKLASEVLRVPAVGYLHPIHVERLPWDDATAMIEQANRRRETFRGLALHESQVSPMEIALCAAFLYYKMQPLCQVPIGAFDADFFFSEQELVVEVDGFAYHRTRRKQDAFRDEIMRHGGYEILRFDGRTVFRDPLLCAREVQKALDRMRSAA